MIDFLHADFLGQAVWLWLAFAAIVAALLLAFVGGIAFNMARGNAPDCHCFGQLHSEPAGRSSGRVAKMRFARIAAISSTMMPPTISASGRLRQKPSRTRSRLMSSIITTNRNSTITAPT